MTDHFDYSRIKNYKLYTLAVPVAKFIMSLKYKLRYEGKENLPKTGAYIVSANHLTSFDPVLLAMNSGRVIHFMAKYETFEKPFTRFFLTHFNSFPVKRGSSDKSSIEYAINLIKHGEVIGIFPEGTRNKEGGEPQKAKSGVALIAKATNADVVPCSIHIGEKKGFRRPCTVRYGKLIKFEDLGFSEESRSTSEIRNASRIIFDETVALWRKGL
ncbi:MAG: 1-acyl-sn-glycerol-3-phosphate acyltransferase [Clostridia bacterium]|nr:1-acyl-sn-glycerol-3-phosphate acyltransferase [Clostridia bacterium]